MFHGASSSFIKVKVGVITTCVDRPERTSLFQVGDHNGTFTLCWGIAGKVDPKRKENCLPSCAFCRHKRALDFTGFTIHDPGLGGRKRDSPSSGSASSSPKPNRQRLNDASQNAPTGPAPPPQTPRNDDASSPPPPSPEPYCKLGLCSSWNITDPNMTFHIPKDYPTRFDPNGPQPPSGRPISPTIVSLPMIKLSLDWLTQAAQFSHHNAKTKHPSANSSRSKYWNKGQFLAFARTCGFTGPLCEAIHNAALDDKPCPIPIYWRRSRALQKCHYAAMHMIFLGQVKANFEIISKWLSCYELLTKFGRQANEVLEFVRRMRMTRFAAYPLSKSTTGTGAYVSENYLFLQRVLKFLFTLPGIHQCNKKDSSEFQRESKILQRFVMASCACISSIMTKERGSERIRKLVPIYLDCMAEMDDLLLVVRRRTGKSNPSSLDIDALTEIEQFEATAMVEHSNRDENKTNKKARKSAGKKDTAYVVRSNSLGMLHVADAHDFFGPAILTWEGDDGGEKGVQTVKQNHTTRRCNVRWEKLTMQTIYTNNTLEWLHDRITSNEETIRFHRAKRYADGLFRVFKSVEDCQHHLENVLPIGAVEIKGSLFMLHRSKGDSRSAISLLQLKPNDNEGSWFHYCWFTPVTCVPTRDVITFENNVDLLGAVRRTVMLLPLFSGNNSTKHNVERRPLYYIVGDDWSERVKGNAFTSFHLPKELFDDWAPDNDLTPTIEGGVVI